MAEPTVSSLSRRQFLQATGATGLFLFFSIHEPLGWAANPALPPGFPKPPEDFNAYLRIGADGRVTCCTGKIEMGQGVFTSLQQMLAEELDVALDSVDIIMGDTSLCPFDMGTFGSMSTRFFGPPLRKAGAEARQVLLEMAAEKMKVPVEKLSVENGTIFHLENHALKVTYGALANGKRIARTPKGPVNLKSPSQFKIIGVGTSRKDGPDKVTGKAQYAADITVPGMLYAKILRPPAHGVTLLEVDFSAAKRVPGVEVVREKDFVAVLHKAPDVAALALQKIKARFSAPTSTTDETTIFEHLLKNAPPAKMVGEAGNLESGEAACKAVAENTYYNDYVAHAAIEPHAAVVKIEGKQAFVWASTQTPFPARDQVAKELGFAPEDVRVTPTFLGGGFGGKSANQQIIEAARCARLSGKPVQVAWTREEEFFFDTYRPAAIIKIKSGITSKGQMALWDFGGYYAGDRGADIFYNVPHRRTQIFGNVMERAPAQSSAHPFAVGPWRAPGNNTNTFARESQVDIMAEKAKIDPVQFRLRHLTDKKFQHVLQLAAEKFHWKEHKHPTQKGIGVACGFDAGTFVAMMAEVAVEQTSGEIQVKRVVCAQDMGLVINPRGAKVQMEGSVIMGLGYTLREMLHFKNGQILDTNFGSYELPRFSWIPTIETYLVESRQAEAQGGGEPSIVTVGAVIANAVYDAVGARLYQLPMTPDRVLTAIKNS